MKLFSFLGNLLILSGLVILFLIFSPVLIQEVDYQVKKNYPQEYQLIGDPRQVEEAEKEATQFYRQKLIIPKSFDFSLVIPRVGINSEVFANVNSAIEEEYLPILKQGVAHDIGSSLPDQPGPVFIFGHSTDSFYNITRYNAAFFLLRKLEADDEIYVFYNNKKYYYLVVDKKIVKPEEVDNEVKKLEGNFLVLQTCWPPGTILKRLLVIARLANSHRE